jgi:hypothetical protein
VGSTLRAGVFAALAGAVLHSIAGLCITSAHVGLGMDSGCIATGVLCERRCCRYCVRYCVRWDCIVAQCAWDDVHYQGLLP